ncbi:MAG: heavy-metal-associated domain-containing protein [Anaeromyxobacter sp.]|nr:heavy-metal-associated domain-containing protein [Anaeromyxobacter sp.]MBL0278251.1 heavy-metal-associated domain-containing protein [Anaeromyxobacter sp.]
MKTLAALLAALLLPTLALAAEAQAAAPAAAEVKPADAKVTIPVGGMTCGGCVNNVGSSLKKLDGVKTVEVNLEQKKAFVTYDASKVTAKQLVAAISEAGFEPGVPAVN